MSYESWKKLSPRKKAIWPASNKGYLDPQHQVTISLDHDLAEWLLTHVVGRSSFSSEFEETIITLLRVMRGELSNDYFSALQAAAGASKGKSG